MNRAVVAYIPALHQGYLNFFKNYPGDLFILGPEFLSEQPRLDRDIRAMEPAEIAKAVSSLGLMSAVRVLQDKKDLKAYPKLVMPDEDVSHTFAKKYLKGKKVEFVSTFLRWDGHSSAMAFETPSHRVISAKQLDKELMKRAESEAKKSSDWWRQIGGVLVKNSKPVITGYNRPLVAKDYTLGAFGDPRSNFDYGQRIELVKTIHAEAGIIAEAAKRGIKLEGTSMYVTTFPCPACAKLIAAAGIKKVYYRQGYSLLDAEDVLSAHGVEIILVK